MRPRYSFPDPGRIGGETRRPDDQVWALPVAAAVWRNALFNGGYDYSDRGRFGRDPGLPFPVRLNGSLAGQEEGPLREYRSWIAFVKRPAPAEWTAQRRCPLRRVRPQHACLGSSERPSTVQYRLTRSEISWSTCLKEPTPPIGRRRTPAERLRNVHPVAVGNGFSCRTPLPLRTRHNCLRNENARRLLRPEALAFSNIETEWRYHEVLQPRGLGGCPPALNSADGEYAAPMSHLHCEYPAGSAAAELRRAATKLQDSTVGRAGGTRPRKCGYRISRGCVTWSPRKLVWIRKKDESLVSSLSQNGNRAPTQH